MVRRWVLPVMLLVNSLPCHPSPAAQHTKENFSSLRVLLISLCVYLLSVHFSVHPFLGPLWLEGTTFSPGLHALSGPFNLQSIKQFSSTGDFLCSLYSNPSMFSSSDQHSFSVSSSTLLYHASFLSTRSPSSTDHIASGCLFITNILIHSEKGTTYLPHDTAYRSILSQTRDDLITFNNASHYTAHHLAESRHSCLL